MTTELLAESESLNIDKPFSKDELLRELERVKAMFNAKEQKDTAE